MLSITTANLNGIRSAARKGFLDWITGPSNSDLVCVQELKAQSGDMSPALSGPDGFHGYFDHAVQKGYSGTGIYSRIEPLHVVHGFGSEEFDAEGRYQQCDFRDFSLIQNYRCYYS